MTRWRVGKKRTFSCEPLGSFESSIFAFREKEHVRPEAAATLLWRKKRSRAAVKRPEKKRIFFRGRARCQKKTQPSSSPTQSSFGVSARAGSFQIAKKRRTRPRRMSASMVASKEHKRRRVFAPSERRRRKKKEMLNRRAPTRLLFSIRTRLPDASGSAGVSQRLGRVVAMVTHVSSVRAESDNDRTCEIRGGDDWCFFFFFFLGDRKRSKSGEEREAGKSQITFSRRLLPPSSPPPPLPPPPPSPPVVPCKRQGSEHEPVPHIQANAF